MAQGLSGAAGAAASAASSSNRLAAPESEGRRAGDGVEGLSCTAGAAESGASNSANRLAARESGCRRAGDGVAGVHQVGGEARDLVAHALGLDDSDLGCSKNKLYRCSKPGAWPGSSASQKVFLSIQILVLLIAKLTTHSLYTDCHQKRIQISR